MDQSYYEKNKVYILARQRAYKQANRERVRAYNALYRATHTGQIAAYNAATKDMQKVRSRRRYEKRKDEVLAQSHQWYLDNHERARKTRAAYKKKNREAVRIRQMERKRERLKSDPVYHLIEVQRKRMLNALKGIGAKSARTVELLGCTGAEAVAHIEKQFKPGMSWANRREWHIDHIRPLASFDLTDPAQQRQAFHYTNLQPLWARENREKAAKV